MQCALVLGSVGVGLRPDAGLELLLGPFLGRLGTAAEMKWNQSSMSCSLMNIHSFGLCVMSIAAYFRIMYMRYIDPLSQVSCDAEM